MFKISGCSWCGPLVVAAGCAHLASLQHSVRALPQLEVHCALLPCPAAWKLLLAATRLTLCSIQSARFLACSGLHWAYAGCCGRCCKLLHGDGVLCGARRALVYPYGNLASQTPDSRHMSVYLKCFDARILAAGACPAAQFKISLVNEQNPTVSFTKGMAPLVLYAWPLALRAWPTMSADSLSRLTLPCNVSPRLCLLRAHRCRYDHA
jgi:hypothetical protein